MGNPVTGNSIPVTDTDWGIRVEKSITFTGGTANTIGDHDGTADPFDIFTVTGLVVARVFAVCTTALAGASATLEVGVTGGTASIIALTTATNIAVNEIWHDNSPDSFLEASTIATENVIHGSGTNIIGTVKTQNITAGVIKFICCWYPLSEGASVVAA